MIEYSQSYSNSYYINIMELILFIQRSIIYLLFLYVVTTNVDNNSVCVWRKSQPDIEEELQELSTMNIHF